LTNRANDYDIVNTGDDMNIDNIRRKTNWLNREEIVVILENYGFMCYDNETEDELREALISNVEDGTIPEWEVSCT
jgi:hypothetical protein